MTWADLKIGRQRSTPFPRLTDDMGFDNLVQDLRVTLRSLRREARFTAFIILIAGLGIGASSTVFSVINALLLRPLPFSEPEQLVWVSNRNTSGLSGQTTQVNHMLDLRERTETLSALAGYFAFYGVGDNLLSGSGEPERLSGVPVSGNFFDVLGIRPAVGRFFNADESRWNGPKAVVLGHGLWQRRFNSDPNIVGTALTLNQEPYTVVGILPASFDFASVFAPGSRFDLFFPFPLAPETNRWGNTMAMVGRLRPGVPVGQAQAEMKLLGAELTKANPDRNSFEGFVKPLAEQVNGRIRLALWVLAGAVALVMLIVCANLSNLLLARMASRQKEIAIRAALGAGRRRLTAQMLTEGMVLSAAGAIVGVILAVAGTRALTELDAVSIPLLGSARTDLTTLAFTAGIAIMTGVVFGLAPALLAGRSATLHAPLKDASRGSTESGQHHRVRQTLVVSEIALACVLLVGAGLLIRSLIQVLDVDMGFQPTRSATIRVDPERQDMTPPNGPPTSTRCSAACARSPASKAPGSPTRFLSDGTAAGASGSNPGTSPAVWWGSFRDSSATAISARWVFRCAPAAISPRLRRHRASRWSSSTKRWHGRSGQVKTPSEKFCAISATPLNGAWWVSSATCAISPSSRAPATSCTCR